MNLEAVNQLLLDQPFIALFAIIASGLLFGSFTIKGLNLGSSGVLFTALLAGHLGYSIPGGIGTLGLVLFLANAGIEGGVSLVATVQQYGITLFGLGILVSVVPRILAWPLARKLFKLDPLQALGGICGGMTSTPALGAFTTKTDSQVPVISYVFANPVALIVLILITKILIGMLL